MPAPPCTRGDYSGVGGEDMRGLHVFEQTNLHEGDLMLNDLE